MKLTRLFCTFALSASAFTAPLFAQTGYHLTSHIKIGGDGRFDYLFADSAARRLYVSHGNEVAVIDLDAEKVVGRITGLKGVHGIAIASALNRGFISDGGNNQAVIFDLATLKTLGTAPTHPNPDCIVYDAASQRVFTMDGRGDCATAIDAATGKVLGTIPLGGRPEFAAVDGNGKLFVNLEDKSEVVQLDTKSLKVLNHWPIAPGDEPSALSMDTKHNRLFIGCGNEMLVVLDAASGAVVGHFPIGHGVDADAFDPGTQRIFSSQGDGSLTIIHQSGKDDYKVEETLKTPPRARTLAIDEKTKKIYLPCGDYSAPAAPTAKNPHPRASMKADTFEITVFSL